MSSSSSSLTSAYSVWTKLQNLLQTKVFNKEGGHTEITKEEWASTYAAVCKCCGNQAKGRELYARAKRYLTEYLAEISKQFSSLSGRGLSAEEVKQVTNAWRTYQKGLETLDHLLAPLNRSFVSTAIALSSKNPKACKSDALVSSMYSVYEFGAHLWTNKFFLKVEPLVYRFVLEAINTHFRAPGLSTGEIEQEQEQEQEQLRPLITGAIALYGQGGDKTKEQDTSTATVASSMFYKTFYAKKYLTDLEAFYSAQARRVITEEKTFLDYVRRVGSLEDRERTAVSSHFLGSQWASDVDARMYRVFVDERVYLFVDEFRLALDEDRLADAEVCLGVTMGNGLATTLTMRHLYETYRDCVCKRGLAAIDAAATGATGSGGGSGGSGGDPKVFVEVVTEVYKHSNNVIETALKARKHDFSVMRDKAFQVFVNRNSICPAGSTKPAEFLARYIDLAIRGVSEATKKQQKKATGASTTTTTTTTTDEAAQKQVAESVKLLRYINDKDAFMLFYKRYTSKRLIQGASASIALERTAADEMEALCGTSYTSGLRHMLTDYTERNTAAAGFRDSKEWRDAGGSSTTAVATIVPHISVLASAYWALPHEPSDFRAPPEIAAVERAFEAFYTKANSFKRLRWHYQFAKGELTTNYLANTAYTIVCPAYQLGVLLFFNRHKDGGTKEQMQEETALTTQILDCSLFPLTQLRILTHNEKTGVYTLNSGFVGKKQRIALFLMAPNANTGKQQNGKPRSGTVVGDNSNNNNNNNNNSNSNDGGGDDNDEGTPSRDEVEGMLKKQRVLEAQAAVARVMKREKGLEYNSLFNATSKELATRFKLQQQTFDRALDMLIEQEFVEQTKDAATGKKVYKYT